MLQTTPTHVAIIPDGNRRWAKTQGLTVAEGHQRGVDIFRTMMNHAADRGVEAISFWGMSLDNFVRRGPREVHNLLAMFQQQFEQILEDNDVHNRGIRIRVFGQWQKKFPRKLCGAIEAVERSTQKYSNYAMNLFLAYNGTDEMVRAVQHIVDDGLTRVTPAAIKRNLFTKDLPSVDLLIRTGGDPHLSAGFMMWDIADAELYFSRTLWPGFTTGEFDMALNDFANRRRMGGK